MIFALLVLSSPIWIYSQNLKTTVYLFNDDSMVVNIKKVEKWGIISDKNLSFNYKVITKIKTMDRGLYRTIKKFNPRMNIILNPLMEKNQDLRTIIYFQNNDSMDVFVKNIEGWGIVSKENKSINYKVIKKIKTWDREICDSLQKKLPDVFVSKNDNYFIINFGNITVKKKKISANKFWSHFRFNTLFLFNRYEYFDLQINIVPKYFDEFVFQLGSTFGWYKPKKIYYSNDVGYYKKEYNVNSYHIGIGRSITLGKQSFLIMINYAEKDYQSSMDSNSEANKRIAYMSLYDVFGKRKLNFIIGLSYYFDNITVKNKKQKFSANIGIGFTF